GEVSASAGGVEDAAALSDGTVGARRVTAEGGHVEGNGAVRQLDHAAGDVTAAALADPTVARFAGGGEIIDDVGIANPAGTRRATLAPGGNVGGHRHIRQANCIPCRARGDSARETSR